VAGHARFLLAKIARLRWQEFGVHKLPA